MNSCTRGTHAIDSGRDGPVPSPGRDRHHVLLVYKRRENEGKGVGLEKN